MGIRTFLVLVAIALVIWIARRLIQRPTIPSSERKASVGRMVRCAHCGLHVPVNEAVEGPGGWYCSPAHRDAGPGNDQTHP